MQSHARDAQPKSITVLYRGQAEKALQTCIMAQQSCFESSEVTCPCSLRTWSLHATFVHNGSL